LLTTVGLSTVYSVYGETIINVFVVSSTWMTVAMAVGRFAAAVRPLQARAVIGRRMALRCIITVFVACAALNAPRVLWNDLRSVTCRMDDDVGDYTGTTDSSAAYVPPATYYFRWHGYLHTFYRPLLERAYFWFYSVVAILLPLGLLVVVSALLIFRLRQRSRRGIPSTDCDAAASSGAGCGGRWSTLVSFGYRRNTATAAIIESLQLNDMATNNEPSAGCAATRNGSLEDSSTFATRSEVGRRPVVDHRSGSFSSSSSSYTSTLIAVAATHVLLVCPAELLTIARQRLPLSDLHTADDEVTAMPSPSPPLPGIDYNFLAAVLNTLQTMNFAFNFALYFVVNAPFRRLFAHATIGWASTFHRKFAKLVRRICFIECCCCCKHGRRRCNPERNHCCSGPPWWWQEVLCPSGCRCRRGMPGVDLSAVLDHQLAPGCGQVPLNLESP
jgi:hypothetical protein